MTIIRRKSQAIKLFGSRIQLADALGISKQAISQWPERLTQRHQDQVAGAALRMGLIRPSATVDNNETANVA